MSARAARHLATVPGLASALHIAVYAAVRGEIDTGPAVRALRAASGGRVTICYPRMRAGDRLLEFHAVADEAELVPNRLGIAEPLPSAPVVPLGEIDVFLVPGLAFGARGGRLGWGRAYYDTTLAAAPRALRLGYAYDFQVVTSVPQGDTDQPVDFLVTERAARATNVRASLTAGRQR